MEIKKKKKCDPRENFSYQSLEKNSHANKGPLFPPLHEIAGLEF